VFFSHAKGVLSKKLFNRVFFSQESSIIAPHLKNIPKNSPHFSDFLDSPLPSSTNLQQKSNKKVIKKFAMIDKDNELWENMNKGGMTFSRTNWPKQPLFNAEFFDAVSYAKNFKPRTDYWHSLWHEGEMAFLFADTNLGKSILAVQIANEVANKIQRNVLYFDFEHSPQQLRQRYTDESGLQWNCSHFLRRVDVRMAYSNDYHIPSLLDAIERNVVDSKAAAIVIDNISAIITDPCDRRFVRDFLKSLNVIRERYDLAVLVIGHTRRHSRYEPLSVSNAACATTISDLCDSVFAIGQSTTDPHCATSSSSKTVQAKSPTMPSTSSQPS
jgi:hypothetical protein